MSVQYFGSNLSRNGLIFARSSLDCHIFSTLSIDTHLGYSKSHKAIWLYGFMAIIWLYGCNKAVALWLFGYPIWVSMERALKMWQSSEDLAKIRPFLERLEPKYWTDIFSFVYFWNSFANKITIFGYSKYNQCLNGFQILILHIKLYHKSDTPQILANFLFSWPSLMGSW